MSSVDHELFAAFFISGIPALSCNPLSAVTLYVLEWRITHSLSLPLNPLHLPRPRRSTTQNHNILTPTNINSGFDLYFDMDRSQGARSITPIISVLGDGDSIGEMLEGCFEKGLDLFVCCGWRGKLNGVAVTEDIG